jgi:hypothetical protein
VTNPLECPYCLDNLRGRTLVCRIKTQRGAWDNCSVQGVKEDDTLIAKIKEQFPKDQVFYLLQINDFVILCNQLQSG